MEKIKKPYWVSQYEMLPVPDNQDKCNGQDSQSDGQDSQYKNENGQPDSKNKRADAQDNQSDGQDNQSDAQDSQSDGQSSQSDVQNRGQTETISYEDTSEIYELTQGIYDTFNKCDEIIHQPYLSKKLTIDFYSMVERIGGLPDKIHINKATDMIDYDVSEILNRKVTKKSLPQCKSYLAKEEVTVWLDSSGSCERMTNLIANLSEVIVKRHDINLIINDNAHIVSRDFLEGCGLANGHLLSKRNKIMKNLPEKFILSYDSETGTIDIKLLEDYVTNKVLFIFSDSDWFSTRQIVYEYKPKRIIFMDAMSYYMLGSKMLKTFTKEIIFYDDLMYISRTPNGAYGNNLLYIPPEIIKFNAEGRRYYSPDTSNLETHSGIKHKILSAIPMHRKISPIEDWYCAVTPNIFLKNLKKVK